MASATIKKIIIGIVILAIIVIALLFHFLRPKPNIPKPIIINTQNQPTLGNPNAKIHIVAFEDLKCGNCMRFSTTLLPIIEKRYIKTGKAKYTMVNVAFIPGSMPAANAARCVYQQKQKLFFDYIQYIYNHQPPETENWATIPKLLQFASNIPGISINKLSSCIYQSPYTSFIRNNLKMASKLMGGSVATPTVYVNGVQVQPLTLKQFEVVVKAVE